MSITSKKHTTALLMEIYSSKNVPLFKKGRKRRNALKSCYTVKTLLEVLSKEGVIPKSGQIVNVSI